MKFIVFIIALLPLSIAAMESTEKGLGRREFGEIYEKYKLEAMKDFSQQEKALVSLYPVWAYSKEKWESSRKLIDVFARNSIELAYKNNENESVLQKKSDEFADYYGFLKDCTVRIINTPIIDELTALTNALASLDHKRVTKALKPNKFFSNKERAKEVIEFIARLTFENMVENELPTLPQEKIAENIMLELDTLYTQKVMT